MLNARTGLYIHRRYWAARLGFQDLSPSFTLGGLVAGWIWAPAADFGCPQEDEPKSLQAAGLGDVAEETLNRVFGV